MKKLYVVRHCSATGQERKALLTENGVHQAQQLREFFQDKNIMAIISSPFTRAIETIQPTAKNKGLEIQLDERLGERVLSDQHLENWLEESKRTFEDLDLRLTGGETSREGMERIRSVLKDVPDQSILVSHGNITSLLFHSIHQNFGFEGWQQLTNPDVFLLTVDENDQPVEFTRLWKEKKHGE